MYCSKCGEQNVNNESFCKNCGTILNNSNVMNNNYETTNVETKNVSNVVNANQIADIVNPDTKKYAIISIIIGVGGILFSFFVGMSLWLSLILGGLGFEMARKGKSSNNILSIIGYVANSILMFIGILIYICLVLGIIE